MGVYFYVNTHGEFTTRTATVSVTLRRTPMGAGIIADTGTVTVRRTAATVSMATVPATTTTTAWVSTITTVVDTTTAATISMSARVVTTTRTVAWTAITMAWMATMTRGVHTHANALDGTRFS